MAQPAVSDAKAGKAPQWYQRPSKSLLLARNKCVFFWGGRIFVFFCSPFVPNPLTPTGFLRLKGKAAVEPDRLYYSYSYIVVMIMFMNLTPSWNEEAIMM